MSQTCMPRNHLHMISCTHGDRACAYPLGALSCMCKITDRFEASLKQKRSYKSTVFVNSIISSQ